jgi:hypothetical protein
MPCFRRCGRRFPGKNQKRVVFVEEVLFLKKKNQKDFTNFPPGALDLERLENSIKLLSTIFMLVHGR